MKKIELALITLSFVVLSGVLITLVYFVIVVKPEESEKQQYLAIMDACNHQRLYMTGEVSRSINEVRKGVSEEEQELLTQTLDNATSYFHSPEYYQECYVKTLNEWSLDN